MQNGAFPFPSSVCLSLALSLATPRRPNRAETAMEAARSEMPLPRTRVIFSVGVSHAMPNLLQHHVRPRLLGEPAHSATVFIERCGVIQRRIGNALVPVQLGQCARCLSGTRSRGCSSKSGLSPLANLRASGLETHTISSQGRRKREVPRS